MKMTLRWFYGTDSITLEQIRQIPGVVGVIPALYDVPVGEPWPMDKITSMKSTIEAAGLEVSAIESVNVHEEIKLGSLARDTLIENYKKSLQNLGKAGIKMVCYNFMPVFDWTRSDLAKVLSDASTALAYDEEIIGKLTPQTVFDYVDSASNGFELPGWEKSRLTEIKKLFDRYSGVTQDDLFENLRHFIHAIMPVCEEYGIAMGIHPDDPPWSVFGLPRITVSKPNLQRICDLHPSKLHGLTLCTGSLGANPENSMPDVIRHFGKQGRIHFVHMRNIKFEGPRKFHEAPHLSREGSLDMFEIAKALHEVKFDGPLRPDHGRAIWGEVARPGYGLYDRALGAEYILGLFEAIEKACK